MAGFGDTFENDLCKFIFNAVDISGIGASTGITNIWLGLHTADPTDAGLQGDSEGGYPQYTRKSVVRTAGGWVVTNNSVSPVASIDFPQNTSTSTGTFTHASIGVTSAAAGGKILAYGAISPTINFSQNVTPRITTGSSFTLD